MHQNRRRPANRDGRSRTAPTSVRVGASPHRRAPGTAANDAVHDHGERPIAAIPQELEAKLLVSNENDLRAIARLKRLGSYGIRARDTQRLRSVYLDTPSLTLARHGVALRVRRDGAAWETTAKWSGRISGDMHERNELTVPLPATPRLPFALPNGPLTVHLAALVAGRLLQPVLITDIYRRRFDVVPSATNGRGPAMAELALDRVQLRAPRERQPRLIYCEAEIELKKGERQDIVRLARLLRQRFRLRPSAASKFARGMELLHGRRGLADSTAGTLSPEDTLEKAARTVMKKQLARLRRYDPDTRLGSDPEPLHDMRVATRRLRAAVRAFKPGIAKPLRQFLRRELRWLAQLLGAVRDFDVQLDNLQRYCAAAPRGQRARLTSLREHLAAERQQGRQELLAALDSPRYFHLLITLEGFTSGDPRYHSHKRAAHEPVVAVGHRTMKRAVLRLLKCGKRITTAPTADELHALRIRAKRTRYLLEFLRDLTDQPGRRLIKQLVSLQDELGAHQDAVVAVDNVRRYAARYNAQLDDETLLALDELVAAQLRRAEGARDEFRSIWQRFTRKHVSNDLHAALQHLLAKETGAGVAAVETDEPLG